VRVQHRHIIYVQGYDPRGLAQYYRMFRTELRKFGRLYQLAATISRPQVAPDGETASWTIETKASDWQTRTDYDFLRWEDLIQRDLAAPIWSTVFHASWIYWRLVFGGTIARFWNGNWRFATFITYPHFLLFLEALCVFGIAWAFEKGLAWLGVPDPFSIAAATALFVAALGTVLKYTENLTYLLYLLSDTIWTWEFSHRQRPEWDARMRCRGQQRRRGDRRRRSQFRIVPRRRDSGARAEARSGARPPWPAHCAADARRQFPDRRISRRLKGFPRPPARTRDRAVDRLDRLPVAQGRDEFLSLRPRRRPWHRRRNRQAQPDHRAGPVPRDHQARAL
jgi:hypothetical protein